MTCFWFLIFFISTTTGYSGETGLMSGGTSIDTLKCSYTESGKASWYGEAFRGRLTASGEEFNPDSLTAAHKTLPFGTILRVKNLKNDSVVIVRVTDRLPKSSVRCIDLTKAAAIKLDFLHAGITRVKLEAIGVMPIYKRPKTN